MIMVVTSMLSAIIIRSIVAEFILTKILDTPLNIKEMVTELALVAISLYVTHVSIRSLLPYFMDSVT